ncbi:transcription antitermination factor NusB [Egicoccus sp. AB-alg6-2]|uniref:transcription antitermination factor NusB n=1 Tax=Egicoccus sp. AB-alg6-2 TaxID=3242692 RepID=UPI00359E922C
MTQPHDAPHDAPQGRRRSGRRQGTHDPRRARERALKILFQADLRNADPLETLERVTTDASARAMLDDLDVPAAGEVSPIDAFTRRLVVGVNEHRVEIDQLIERFARRWAISRMPVVDRTVLRLATFELTHEDTSPAVVINEAVELAKSLSTDDSGRYVNGVLESVRRSVAGEDVPAEG